MTKNNSELCVDFHLSTRYDITVYQGRLHNEFKCIKGLDFIKKYSDEQFLDSMQFSHDDETYIYFNDFVNWLLGVVEHD